MTDELPVSIPNTFQDEITNVITTNNKSDDTKSKRGRSKIRHICEICGREFTKKCGLSNHLLIHAGVKPFSCEICNKSFTKKCTLTVHLLTHSSERPHVCEVCKKSFARKTDLQKHKFVHTGEKRHICEICNSKFTHQNNLRRHKMKHFPKETNGTDDKKTVKNILGVNPLISKVLKDTANVKNISEILKQALVKKNNRGLPQSSTDTKAPTNGTALLRDLLSTNNIKETFVKQEEQSNISKPQTISKSLYFTDTGNSSQQNTSSNSNNTASVNNVIPVDSLKFKKNNEMITKDQQSCIKKHKIIQKPLKRPIYNVIKNQPKRRSDLKNKVNINTVVPIDSLNLKNVKEIFINTNQQNNSNKPETVFKLLNIVEPICIVSNINPMNIASDPRNATRMNTFIPINSLNINNVKEILLNNGQQSNLNKPGTVLKLLNTAQPICTVNERNEPNITSDAQSIVNLNTIGVKNIKEVLPNKEQEGSSNKPVAVFKLLSVVEPICNVSNGNQQNVVSNTNNMSSINTIPIDSLKTENAKEMLVVMHRNQQDATKEKMQDGGDKILQDKTSTLSNATKINTIPNNVDELLINKEEEGNSNKSEIFLKLLNNNTKQIPIVNNENNTNIISDQNETLNLTTDTQKIMNIKDVTKEPIDREEQSISNEPKVDSKSSNITEPDCSESKENPQILKSDAENTKSVKVEDNHVMNLKESDDVEKARGIKDNLNSLPISVNNNSKNHAIQSDIVNKTVKAKPSKPLPNADSFPEPKSMESQIMLELEKLKKARESLKKYSKRRKSCLSGSESFEKTIKKKDLCQSLSIDNDLEQALAFASDVIKDTDNAKLLLPMDKNTQSINLEGDMQSLNIPLNGTNNTINNAQFPPPIDKDFQNIQSLNIPLNGTNNTINNAQFPPPIDKDFQNMQSLNIPLNGTNNTINNAQFPPPIDKDFQNITIPCKDQKSFAENMQILNISTDVTENSINYNQFLIPNEDTLIPNEDTLIPNDNNGDIQNISLELKILDDIVKEYETSQKSMPNDPVDAQLLSAIHNNVQCIPSELQVLEDNSNDVQVIDTPSTTVHKTFMEVQVIDTPSTTVHKTFMDVQSQGSFVDCNNKESEIQTDSSDEIQILSSTFDNAEKDLLNSQKPFSCDVCSNSFNNQKEFLVHVSSHISDEQTTCYLCDLELGDNGRLREHILTHYQDDDEEEEDEEDDISLDDDFCKIGPLSPGDISLQDFDSIGFTENFEEDVAKMYALAHIDMELNGYDSDTDDEATILYSYSQIEDLSNDGHLAPDQPSEIPTEDTVNKNNQTLQIESETSEPGITQTTKDICFDFSKFNFMTQMQVPLTITDKSTSEANSQESKTDTNQNSFQTFPLSIKNIIGCSSVPATTNSTEDDDLNTFSIDDINVTEIESAINHELLMIENKDDNINQIENFNKILSAKDVFSQINIAENLRQFETTADDDLLLVETKDKNKNRSEVSNNVINKEDVLPKLNIAKSIKEIDNTTNDKFLLMESMEDADLLLVETKDKNKNRFECNNVINEEDVLPKLNIAKSIKEIDNTINDKIMLLASMESKDKVINKIENTVLKEEDALCISKEKESEEGTDSNIEPNYIPPQIIDLDINRNEDSSDSSIMDDTLDNNKPPFVCDFCDKTFPQKKYLHAHYLMHAGIKQYDCKDCSKKFGKKCALTTHSLVHTQERKHGCNVCGKTFSRKNDLQMHAIIHTGQKPFSCDQCKKSFNNKNNLRRHQHSMENRKKFICYICNSRFSERLGLLSHVKIHIKQAEMKSASGKLSENIRNCLMSMKEKFYECDVCHMLLARKDRLMKHKLTHVVRDTHLCEFCGSTFKTKEQLKVHLSNHTQNEFEDIGFGLGNLGNIDLASLEPTIETTKKTYTCDRCLKVYTKSSALKCHYLTHTGKKPHKCHLCDKKFAQRTNLKRHILSHSGIKPFMCNICHKHFARKPYLRKHYLSHTSEELFTLLGNLPDV